MLNALDVSLAWDAQHAKMDERRTRREIFSKYYQINPKSDCIYHFPCDLEPSGQCPFGSRSIVK